MKYQVTLFLFVFGLAFFWSKYNPQDAKTILEISLNRQSEYKYTYIIGQNLNEDKGQKFHFL